MIAIDENGNGLSDVWEQRFNASALELLGDDDGDGFSNLEECIAGTDPYDAEDLPKLEPTYAQETSDQMRLSFRTIGGKHYSVQHSSDLEAFEAINQGWLGDASIRELEINKSGLAKTISPIRAEFWAELSGNSIEALYNHSNYPATPDGQISAEEPAAPIFAASQYGARISFWMTPPEDGSYTFYLSSGGPAELHLIDESDTEIEDNVIAEVLPLQVGLEPGDWDTYGTQRSEAIALVGGEHYKMELRYISIIPRQHTEIAWSGPNIDGIQRLDRSQLSTTTFHAETESLNELLRHDYDSIGQTNTLWPANTAVITAPAGMPGNAEQVTGDTASNTNDERVFFNQPTSTHLYATWLFHMANASQDVKLIFMNGSDNNQEGPRIDIEDRDSGTRAAVRAGGPFGSEEEIYVEFEETYRIELVGTLSPNGFSYQTPGEQFTVAEDSFDIYVSDPNRNLIGAARGLSFRDGSGVVDAISSLHLRNPETPNISFDSWDITSGQILGDGYLIPNHIDFGEQTEPNFFELEIQEQDQDGDGIPDWEELALAAHYPFLFFDPDTTNGTPDQTSLQQLLVGTNGNVEVALYASDAAAFESNFPNTIPDNGEITITRTGPLTPITLSLCIAPLEETGSTATVCDGTCCILVGSAGDEEAEIEDYQLIDEAGTVITDTVHFEFGEMSKVLTLRAIDDNINEYPETVNLAIATAADGSYTISNTQNGASIQLFDLPDNPDNLTIFTGTFSEDGAAVVASSGSGFITATLNGTRTELRIWNEFSGLTSAQQDAHIHKSGPGPSPGAIIYEITETPGDPETDPLNGALTDYPWDISDSSGSVPTAGGAASKQVIIDSLFGQNEESPLY
ncbi:MAG: PA14 domain-containing protein, partial [Verrucomicrobiota bacterium]